MYIEPFPVVRDIYIYIYILYSYPPVPLNLVCYPIRDVFKQIEVDIRYISNELSLETTSISF